MNEATTRQFSQVDTRITDAEGRITKQTTALAEFKTYAANNYASASVMATVQNELTGKATKAELSVTANNLQSSITATANQVNTVANQVTTLADSVNTISRQVDGLSGISASGGQINIMASSSVVISGGSSVSISGSQVSILYRSVKWDTITYAKPGGGSDTKSVLVSSYW